MCAVSMVARHYENTPLGYGTNGIVWPQPSPFQAQAELEALRTLVSEFKEAMAAAKRVDVLTNQPDCEDMDKKRDLEARVVELERRLDAQR